MTWRKKVNAVNRKGDWKLLALILLLLTATLLAGSPPPVSTVFAVLTKSLESKNAAVGQEFDLRTISEVVVKGEVVMPRVPGSWAT
ncbi:MAG: hypothetical protein ABR501_02670 [Pyrinomonadaceae bacterium]